MTYYEKHRDECLRKVKEYQSTPIGKATKILNDCRKNDRKHNRGECTLTAEWIVENIFSQSCVHCGETDWHKLSCNRLDNTKPHTMDNVEPCCIDCNNRLGYEYKSKKVYQYTLDGELVKEWKSTAECGRNGYCQACILKCCKNLQQKHKGFKWSYIKKEQPN